MSAIHLDRLYRKFEQFHNFFYFYRPFIVLFGRHERELLFERYAATALLAGYEDTETLLGEKFGTSSPDLIDFEGTSEMLHFLLHDCQHYKANEQTLKAVVDCFGKRLEDPSMCAQIKSARSLILTEYRSVVKALSDFVVEPNNEELIYDSVVMEELGFTGARDFAKQASQELWSMDHGFFNFSTTLDYLSRFCRVDDRFPFYETAYNLYIPPWRDMPFLNPIQRAIVESTKEASLIFKLSSRDFEKYIAELFVGFGYDVELTSKSGDGGVDVLCMRARHGIPLRLAVEVKRYSERNPVGVELVRQFVGANRSIKANKLVFVTSSRFTEGAVQYQKENIDLLELKNLRDVLDWANIYTENLSTFSTKRTG